jgi:GT2 family glycosyltransferase
MYSIIIPHYKNNTILEQCLNSIIDSLKETDQQTSIEVIVVINQASEVSKQFIKQYQKDNYNLAIKPIFNQKNKGFAQAVNQGIKKAHGDYLVVLNNDIKLDQNWFNAINKNIQMFKNSKTKKIGAIFGKVLNEHGTKIESAGFDFKPWGKAINSGNNDPYIDKFSQEKVIWGAPASAVVYNKQALDEIGLFNPVFFAYLEDVDLSLRLQANNYQTLYVPKAVSYHQGGYTADQWTDFRQKYTSRNWWFIFILHYPLLTFIKYLPLILIEQLKIWLKIKKWKNKLWVVKQIISHLPKLLNQRKTIKIKNDEA